MPLQLLEEYLSNIQFKEKKLVYHALSIFHSLKALNLISEEYQIIIKHNSKPIYIYSDGNPEVNYFRYNGSLLKTV